MSTPDRSRIRPRRMTAPLAFASAGLAFAIASSIGCVVGPGDDLASGDLTATPGGHDIDVDARTHVIVIGASHGLGTQLIQLGLDRARRYRQLYPNEQIVFFATGEDETADELRRRSIALFGAEEAVKTLDSWKQSDPYSCHYEDGCLRRDALLGQLEQLASIASIDFFTHQAPVLGPRLENDGIFGNWLKAVPNSDGTYSADHPDNALLAGLADNFTERAYVTFNGCNAGVFMAPLLSSWWHIPVAGAISSTRFEKLHADNHWYSTGSVYRGYAPEGLALAAINTVSFDEPVICPSAGCVRIVPEIVPYRGRWGRFETGIPFQKFFCNYDGGEDECRMAMALSLFAFVADHDIGFEATWSEYQDVLFDYLCPAVAVRNWPANCRSAVLAAVGQHEGPIVDEIVDAPDLAYSAFHPLYEEPNCTLHGCDLDLRCDSGNVCGATIPDADGDGRPDTNPAPTNIAREYALYRDGFALLMENMASPTEDDWARRFEDQR